ncbi:MAG: glycosyltransferase [Patescibacteria group bacterium]
MIKKIKILHILPNLSHGGAERVCFNILNNLNLDKFSPSLLLFKENNSGNEFKSILKSKGIEIISLEKKGLIDLKNFFQIINEIKKIQPDIIHTHLGGDIYGRFAAKICKTPVIVSTEHNLNYSERTSAAYLKTFSAKYANKIFAVSEAVKKDAIKRYNLNPEKIETIYNGIDLNIFKTESENSRTEKENYVLGGLGRLTEQKGFATLIDAVLKTKHKNYQVNIAGTGELETELKNRIKTLGLSDRINLLGLVDSKKFIDDLDIFIFPSNWEGLGLAVLEAAALKKPIIASNIDGVKEIINLNSGLLFEANNVSNLAEKIDYLIDNINSSETQERVKAAHEKVVNTFSLEKMIKSYESAYENLINKYENITGK